MKDKIPPANLLFLLAYAFDLKWEYLERDVGQQDIKDLSFFELLVFVLSRWTEELVRRGLYKTFIDREEETKRLRGRILFQPNLKSGKTHGGSLFCQFDDLSFDTLENQILLSTLQFCDRNLSRTRPGSTRESNNSRRNLLIRTSKLARLLSSEISYKPLSFRLLDQTLFHRMNIKYKPVLQVCRFIYDSASFRESGEDKMFDVPEDKMSTIFERFLRNYLAEVLTGLNFRVDKSGARNWVVSREGGQASHIPSIYPDIVIWKEGEPRLIIDAKFYKTPVYKAVSRTEADEEEPEVYKTHSHNLYQLVTYTDYFNCDGLLVYVQTETGPFHEIVQINPKYYPDQDSCYRKFGFRTLDLTGELEEFKIRMEGFAEGVANGLSGQSSE